LDEGLRLITSAETSNRLQSSNRLIIRSINVKLLINAPAFIRTLVSSLSVYNMLWCLVYGLFIVCDFSAFTCNFDGSRNGSSV